jgi:hypothetical protein
VGYGQKHIREASYELLLGYIKDKKEKIEIEAGVAAPDAPLPGLPDELLSIIIDTDTTNVFSSAKSSEEPTHETSSIERDRRLGNLMSWSLTFSFFTDSVLSRGICR